MKKITFREIIKKVPKPKILGMDDRLPGIFDTMWDAKTYRNLYYRNGRNAPTQEQLRMLREHGYDTTQLPTLPKERYDDF